MSPASPAVAAANPNPDRQTAETWWLMEQLLALEPSTRNGGIYVDKPGYHNTRAGNSSDDYSVRDPEDQGGPSDKAAGYDWTFPDAQSRSADLADLASSEYAGKIDPADFTAAAADYSTIAKYSSRLLASGRDPEDPRLDGWKEFFGQADNDLEVEGYDFRDDENSSSDDSHLWHIHLSEDRNKVESLDNKKALLSVLRGETVAQWMAPSTRRSIGDYNRDGQTDRALYRPSDGRWYIQYYRTGGVAVHPQLNPAAGDVPAPGDYNGDGQFDRMVWNPNGEWKLTYYGSNATAVYRNWGQAGDIPVPGDYNKDGVYDHALYRPSDGKWYIRYQYTGGTAVHPQLNPADGDIPVPGDYNGDGQFDRAVWNPTGEWKITYYASNDTAIHRNWGQAGDVPVTQ